MILTALLVSYFVGLLLTSVLLWVWFLRIGLRWAKVSDVTMRRVGVATAVVITLQVAFNVLFFVVSTSTFGQSFIFQLLEPAAAVIMPVAVISSVFKTRYLRAAQAWLPTLLSSALTLAFIFLVQRPFLYEAFAAPTNSMAPTLLGLHWRGICSECGKPNYGTPARERRFGIADPTRMICDGFHVTESSDVDTLVHSADRFMVTKFLRPRRWDLAVFQYPENPADLYVKRLIGLPGEKIHIQDGAVWVDGKRLTPPDSLQGIEYLSEFPNLFAPELWGTLDRPAVLGENEYFVLGDFSVQSMDSRFWKQGAPGHNPFAVPESYMRGVLTHTFWPPQRLRIHR
jgi:signal peptidase I